MARLTVSTRVLSQKSGLPVRQVHTFADAGVLVPDGTEAPGRGGSRQFPVSEVEVATLLGAIAHKGMSVSEAYGIAAVLRFMVCAPNDLGFRDLDQARKLRCYLHACLETSRMPHESIPDPHQFMHYAGIIKESKLLWSHVEPAENNLRRTEAWIALQLAKRGEADPIIFLYRSPDETWLYEFWAILATPSDDRHEYRLGTACIQVKQIRTRETRDKPDLEFEKILIELIANDPRHRADQRGGYVIMPRKVYAKSISDSN